jgi:hypothetical protein
VTRTIAAVAAIASLLASPAASAQSIEEFYKSRSVTIMVGFNVGNIYDTVMRAVARHIGKHIPGNPTVIPVNRPGAGSLAAANQVFNASPRDGTVIGVFNRSIPTEPLLGSSGAAKFDATKFTWIGNVGNEVSVCVTRRETGAKTWNDMITKPMQVAVTSTSADTGVYPLLLNNMFGAKLKLVTGYQGGADMTLALERGEVDGRCGWSLGGIKTARPTWLKDGPINFPVQLGLRSVRRGVEHGRIAGAARRERPWHTATRRTLDGVNDVSHRMGRSRAEIVRCGPPGLRHGFERFHVRVRQVRALRIKVRLGAIELADVKFVGHPAAIGVFGLVGARQNQ